MITHFEKTRSQEIIAMDRAAATRTPIAHVTEIPLLGSLTSAIGHRKLTFLKETARAHPGLSAFSVLGHSYVLVSAPDLAHEILTDQARLVTKALGLRVFSRPFLGDNLITLEGDAHWGRKRGLLPRFQINTLRHLRRAIVAHARAEFLSWRQEGRVDLDRASTLLTMKMAAATLFGADLEGAEIRVAGALLAANHASMKQLAFARFPRVSALLPFARQVRSHARTLDEVLMPIIETRAKASAHAQGVRDGAAPKDVLDIILALRDSQGEPLPPRAVRDEMVGVFSAGHDTTANALAWLLCLLALNPHWRDRAREEAHAFFVKAELGRCALSEDAFASYPWDDCKLDHELPIVTACIHEALRMFPPGYLVGRTAAVPLSLGGHHIKAGADIAVNLYGIHMRPDFFAEPETFDPSRFLDAQASQSRPKGAYMPFISGPRACIGAAFAMQQLQLVMLFALHHLDIRLEGEALPRAEPLVTLKPKGPVWARVAPRS